MQIQNIYNVKNVNIKPPLGIVRLKLPYQSTMTPDVPFRLTADHCVDLFTLLIQDPWLSKWRPDALIKQNKLRGSALHGLIWSKLHFRKNESLRLLCAPPLPRTSIFSSWALGDHRGRESECSMSETKFKTFHLFLTLPSLHSALFLPLTLCFSLSRPSSPQSFLTVKGAVEID